MDGLSAATSAFAVVSLAIQLAESVAKIRDFYNSFYNASKQLNRIVDDLALLQTIFGTIASASQLLIEGMGTSTLYTALERCRQQIKHMEAFVNGLNSDFVNRPHRSALKIVISKGRIAEFEAQLESTKTTLITAIGIANLFSQYACHEIIAAQLDELRSTIIEAINHPIVSINTSMVGRISDNQGVVGKHLAFDKKCQETLKSVYFRIDSANLALILARLAPNTSLWSYNRLCGYILGSIQYLSQRRIIVSNGFQDAKSDLMEYQRDRRVLTIILPLLRYVVIYKSSAIYSKWTRSVILSRVISDKSPIWHLCSKGDIMGMRRLFEAGLASPYDISSCGRSLLHEAVQNSTVTSINTIKWLLEIGLDSNTYCDSLILTNTPFLCLGRLELAWGLVDNNELPIQEKIAIEVAGLFLKHSDFQPDDYDFGRVASLYGVNVIEWFLCQDYYTIPQKSLDMMLSEACWRVAHPRWQKVVRQLIEAGADIHCTDNMSPLNIFLDHHMDAERWLQVLYGLSIDLDLYAIRERKRYYDGNYRWSANSGIRRVKYACKSHGKQVRIWLGSLKGDWETAFEEFEPKFGSDPRVHSKCSFGLEYLFDGFVTDEDIEREWEQKTDRESSMKSIPKPGIDCNVPNAYGVWLWWIILSYVCCHYYFSALYYR